MLTSFTNFQQRTTFIVLLFFTARTYTTSEAAPRPMTPIDFLSVPEIKDPHLSPDGASLVFVRTDADWQGNHFRSNLWLQKKNSDDAKQLTFDREDVSSPKWSPDGKKIAFLANPSKSRRDQLFLLSLDGGEAHQLSDHPTPVKKFQWSPDGKSLYYLAENQEPSRSDYKKSLRLMLQPFDTPPKQHLWKMDIATGETHRVTSGEFNIESFNVSQDGSLIVFERSPGANIDDRHRGKTWLMDGKGENQRKISHREHEHLNPKLSPDNRFVLYLAGVNEQGETYYGDNLFVLDLESNKPAKLMIPDFPHELHGAFWGTDSSTIYFIATLGVHSELFEFNSSTEQVRQLTDGKHDLRDWSYSRDSNSFALQLRTNTSPGDFWLLEEEGKQPIQLTHLFDHYVEQFAIPEQILVTWEAQDGQQIEGLLTLPVEYEKGQRYPLIVQTHGGPRSSDKYGMWRWRNYQPVLAELGYVTLAINYRGSTGYGDDFTRDMVGNYWRHAHQDVLDGVDHLIDQGIADPERLGAMGWSAGGHMTNKLITVTNRFKAASSGAGAVDWVSMYGQSDTRFNRGPWFGGSPWQKDAPLDSYREQSPLKDMWRVKTPTLVFVGENDDRVPATQSILLARALRDHGVPSHLYVGPGQGHDWKRPYLRLFKVNAELEWFERYVREKEYEWQELPSGDE